MLRESSHQTVELMKNLDVCSISASKLLRYTLVLLIGGFVEKVKLVIWDCYETVYHLTLTRRASFRRQICSKHTIPKLFPLSFQLVCRRSTVYRWMHKGIDKVVLFILDGFHYRC